MILNGFVPGSLEHRVRVGSSTQAFNAGHNVTRKPRKRKGIPPRQPSPYLSWLVSITRLTVGDSVMRACTLCWPETRDTSFSESCPAPVESSCLS